MPGLPHDVRLFDPPDDRDDATAPDDRDDANPPADRHDLTVPARGDRSRPLERAGASACGDCLARTWLIARLAGSIEIARHQRRRLREILALPNEKLIAGLGGVRASQISDELERLDIDALRDAVDRAGLDAICRHDAAYPARLTDLTDAPAVLFVAGGVDRFVEMAGGDLESGPRAVAVVGTRRASPDGLEIATSLGRGLAAAGVTVVSGMALGVDSAAHSGAVIVGGRTIAVLAGGADVPYPPTKARLYARVIDHGCVVAELPPGFVARRWCFPARNRIIAALGHATLVVEAARRSGSLITAEIATDLGRDVGAVPGPVTAWRSAGANALLRDGATLIRHASDALDLVVGIDCHEPPALHLPLRLRELLAEVSNGRDTVASLTTTPSEVHATLAGLTELELLGHLRRVAGGRYVVIPR
jgi:DNA processing protein